MKYQDYMKDVTKASALEAFRYAKAVPKDKVDWKPLDEGRSVLEQCREMAMCPDWANSLLGGIPEAADQEADMAKQQEVMSSWSSVEECEAQCLEKLDKLFATFDTITDEQLKDTKWLPYDGGRDFTFAEMMDYPRWNFNYHLGQVSYIQCLYGDKEMH